MNLEDDLFAVHGDVTARFHDSFAFIVLQFQTQTKQLKLFTNLIEMKLKK